MKLTIDNHDGKGAIDYSACVVAGRPFRILRRLNEPVTCAMTLFPAQGLAMPARNGRVIVSDDSGIILFTGYIGTEPALELAGQATTGAVYRADVSAISDDILLSRQPLPQGFAACGATASQALETLTARMQIAGITPSLSQGSAGMALFEVENGRTWAENAALLANATRNAWRLMNGTLTLLPIGDVTHALNEEQGTLSPSNLSLSMVKALANDVTVCGATEACAYVTEFFQGDGTTVLFNLSERPWMPAASRQKPLLDLFQGPAIDPQLWAIGDPSGTFSLTSAGLTCAGGGEMYGSTTLSALSNVELGGSLIIEAANVQFGQQTSGILNGIYGGDSNTLANCLAGFQIAQPNGVTTMAPLIGGVVAGSSFTPVTGHSYTLRLRFYANEPQRILQAYYAVGTDIGTECFGGTFVGANASVELEVQDTTNGIAGVPTVLYSGTMAAPPPYCLYTLLNALYLQCSIGSVTIEEPGPVWVTSTPSSGTAFVRRLGTAAQGADCEVQRAGTLQFYPASTPQAGELIAVSYRTSQRSVARLASATSIAEESVGGTLPGTACWMGSVLSPVPRSSADCENAANAILALATSRAAAWAGTYTLWNAEQTSDIWPGDVLAIDSASAGGTANVVVRTVTIDMTASWPGMTRYTVAFANDWADDLAIKTSAAVPADAWLPQQPDTTAPLANLNALTVTSVSGAEIQIAANVTPPAGGGFEVRRRDWAFTPGPGPDLVLRSPVPNFSIARQAAVEQYYVRMYDGSTPPKYSRFSSAVFVNVPL
ncbi:MAG TPA: hypothetical protein VIY53_03220 [Acidobacteriaceae bacterium]